MAFQYYELYRGGWDQKFQREAYQKFFVTLRPNFFLLQRQVYITILAKKPTQV